MWSTQAESAGEQSQDGAPPATAALPPGFEDVHLRTQTGEHHLELTDRSAPTTIPISISNTSDHHQGLCPVIGSLCVTGHPDQHPNLPTRASVEGPRPHSSLHLSQLLPRPNKPLANPTITGPSVAITTAIFPVSCNLISNAC